MMKRASILIIVNLIFFFVSLSLGNPRVEFPCPVARFGCSGNCSIKIHSVARLACYIAKIEARDKPGFSGYPNVRRMSAPKL